MDALLIAGGVGLVLGIGAAWVVGGENGLPLFLGGVALGVGGYYAYSRWA